MNYIIKFLSGLKSRTVWAIIALVIINGVPSARELLPAELLPYVDTILGLLAWHFRITPKAKIAQ